MRSGTSRDALAWTRPSSSWLLHRSSTASCFRPPSRSNTSRSGVRSCPTTMIGNDLELIEPDRQQARHHHRPSKRHTICDYLRDVALGMVGIQLEKIAQRYLAEFGMRSGSVPLGLGRGLEERIGHL